MYSLSAVHSYDLYHIHNMSMSSLFDSSVFLFTYAACQDGPFSLLYTCLKERRRVKVWTRRHKGLRSVLAGYLVAFDKHMNMVSCTLYKLSQLMI